MEADNFDSTLTAFKKRSPFRPFTVALVNGDRFEVKLEQSNELEAPDAELPDPPALPRAIEAA